MSYIFLNHTISILKLNKCMSLEFILKSIELILPVAVSTADWEVLSLSAGRVMSAKPAATRPCGGKETMVSVLHQTLNGFLLYY